jgi:hypothetical protein
MDGPARRRETLQEMKGADQLAGPAPVTGFWISHDLVHGKLDLPGDVAPVIIMPSQKPLHSHCEAQSTAAIRLAQQVVLRPPKMIFIMKSGHKSKRELALAFTENSLEPKSAK